MKQKCSGKGKRAALLLALSMILAFVSNTAKANEVSENLPILEKHYDWAGNPWYDVYFAYNTDGELMFTLAEYAEEYTEKYLDHFPAMYFYTEEEFIQYKTVSLYTLGGLPVTKRKYDKDRTIMKLQITCTLYFSDPLKIENYSFEEPLYAEDGGSYTLNGIKYILNGNGQTTEIYSLKDGEYVLYLSNSYDEYGNITAREYYDTNTGEKTDSCRTYGYQYNETGQPVQTNVYYPDGTDYEEIFTDYITLQSIESGREEYPYAGYWTGEKDGKTIILGISANGFLFEGYTDEENDMFVPENYASYLQNDDGTLHCEYKEYGVRDSGWSADVSVEISDNKLIFDSQEYTPFQ